jgi:ribonuclease VapC
MVETSALVAIILEEPGWRQLAERIAAASAFTTCFNVFEATLAVVREKDLTPSAAHLIVLDTVARLGVETSDYPSRAIPHAIAAREQFGAGRRGLNMGDCLSYGAAKERRARLIYVGEDFARTDVNDQV